MPFHRVRPEIEIDLRARLNSALLQSSARIALASAIGSCIPPIDSPATPQCENPPPSDAVNVYCKSEDGQLLRIILPDPGKSLAFDCASKNILLVVTRASDLNDPATQPSNTPGPIVISGIAIDDSADGNGDRDADYAETVRLIVYLQNVDASNRHDVTLHVDSSAPHEFPVSSRRVRLQLEPGDVVDAAFVLGIWPIDLDVTHEAPIVATVTDANGFAIVEEPLSIRLNERPPPPRFESVAEEQD